MCPRSAPRSFRIDPPGRLHRIAVGYDGGPESSAALALAASIAVGAGAELQVHAVVDDRLPGLHLSRFADLVGPSWDEVIDSEIDQIREQAVAAARPTGAPFEVAVARGRPADTLLALAETVDLLVIGSRRWGPSARLLLGSTGEAVMHDAACPVLAVPRPSH